MVMIVICFFNGRQELKFKCKTDQLIKEKLWIGNLSDQWTASESEKTGLYGSIYDFVVDYEQIVGVTAIYDMHRYLMTKHKFMAEPTAKSSALARSSLERIKCG